MKFENLEDKCRYYQKIADYTLLPNSYVLVHCDGRSFSRLIKNEYEKPFDETFINMMNETAKYLCAEVQGCKCAFVQSDEISLVLTDINKDGNNGTVFFNGRMCKMISSIAALATSKFNQLRFIDEIKKNSMNPAYTISSTKLAQFDCKVWNVPNLNDAVAWFLYRQLDCIKNSKQQFAQTYCSHKELLNLNTDEQVALAFEKHSMDWNAISDDKKYGRFIFKEIHEEMGLNPKTGEAVQFQRSSYDVSFGLRLSEAEDREKLINKITSE